MIAKYLPPGRPGESPAAALHRRTDSPAQASLRRNARAAWLFALPFALVLAGIFLHDTLTIHGIQATARPEVHRARGIVDVIRPSRRRPVFRLARPGEPPLLFTCSPSVPSTPRCPTASQDWRARELSVEWITMPALLRVETPDRATRMAAGDELLFAAPPRAVQEAEAADLTAGIQGAARVFGGLMLACFALAAHLRARLWFLTRKIEAAHRRARS